MTTMWWAVFLCLGMRCAGERWVVTAFAIAALGGRGFVTGRAGDRSATGAIDRNGWRRATVVSAVGLILFISASTRAPDGDSRGADSPFVASIAEWAGERSRRGPLSDRARALLRALLIADRDALPAETVERYRYLGIAHLLALSGLHLGVVLVGCNAALAAVGLRGRRRRPVAAVLSVLYGAAAGFPPSLVRALILGGASLAGRIAGRAPSLERSLWLSLLIAAFLLPGHLSTVSFGLSLAAVASIVYIAVPLVDCLGLRRGGAGRHLPRRMCGAVVFSASITAGMLPVTTTLFGRTSLWAPIVTIVAVVPVTLYLYIGLIYMLITSRSLPLVAALIEPLALLLDKGATVLSRLPCPAIYRNAYSLPVYATGLLVLVLAVRSPRRPRLLPVAVILLVVSLVCGGPVRGTGPSVERIAGRATLIEDGARILVVERAYREADAGRIVSAAWRRGIGRLDLLVIPAGNRHAVAVAARISARIAVGQVALSPYAAVEKPVESRGGTIATGTETIIDTGAIRTILGEVPFPPPVGRPRNRASTGLPVTIVSLRDGEELYRRP